MSYTQKNLKTLLDELNERQTKQEKEVDELKHIKTLFQESEKAKSAKEVAWSGEMEGLRKKFSHFFVQRPEGQEVRA